MTQPLRLLLIACGLLASLVAAPSTVVRAEEPARPHNVIFMIPDGCGAACFTLARAYLGRPLTLDSLLVGGCITEALDERVTDSASSATAYACGIRTNNAFIGMDATKRPVATVMEAAEARGMATGIAVTSRVTHATPACFAAHVADRWDEPSIAAQEAAFGLEVILGGGSDFFLPSAEGGRREDGRNLVREMEARGVHRVADRRSLLGASRAPLLGLFTPSHMNYEIDRDPSVEPSLREMTEKAIELLSPDRDGFFLLAEGSRIDHAAHMNDPAALLHEVLAYDEAVAAALDFARRDGRTLVISVADHETGGMSLSRQVDGEAAYAYHPEVLGRVRASVPRLTERLRAGEEAEALLRDGCGFADPTAEEVAAVEEMLALGEKGKDWQLEATLSEIISTRAGIGWTTYGHTAVDVGVYAFGPGAERFRGLLHNDELGRRLAELMHFDLAALTARMRKDAVRAEPAPHGRADGM